MKNREQIVISSELLSEHPNYVLGIILIEGLKNGETPDKSYQYLSDITDRIRRENATSKELNTLLQAKGDLPSNEALTRRILTGVDLPNINPIVNLINAVQIDYQIAIGAHDIDKTEGDIHIDYNKNGLSFHARDTDEKEAVPEDEIVYHDENSVLTRKWRWRQGVKSLTDEQSKNVVLVCDMFDVTQKEADETLRKVATVARTLLNTDVKISLGILDKGKPSASFSNLEAFTQKPDLSIVPGLAEFEFHPIIRDEGVINEILEKAAEEILPNKEGLAKLLNSGRRLKVYIGVDPTAPTLHIGHLVSLRRLELFRKLGHKTFLLMGNFTAQIGDPDKKDARKQLTFDQVQENLKKYKDQAKTVIDMDNATNPVTVVFNNDWLGKLNFADILDLASKFTVQQMMGKQMFAERQKENRPIYIHEFMYPMMQGYDCAQLECDVQMGGSDQLFNMLAGRQLVSDMLGKENFIISGKLLTTPDGRKMGKTEGNMISIEDSSNDIYGKVMSFPDEMVISSFEMLTDATISEIAQYAGMIESGIHPMKLKKTLAFRVTEELKGRAAAQKAELYFEKIFQHGDSEEAEVREVKITGQNSIMPIDLLVHPEIEVTKSRTEAKRLVEQGAARIDGVAIKDWREAIELSAGREFLLKVGKSAVRVVVR